MALELTFEHFPAAGRLRQLWGRDHALPLYSLKPLSGGGLVRPHTISAEAEICVCPLVLLRLRILTMLAKVCSAAVNGIEAYPVEVEVNAGYGDTVIVIIVNKTPNPHFG